MDIVQDITSPSLSYNVVQQLVNQSKIGVAQVRINQESNENQFTFAIGYSSNQQYGCNPIYSNGLNIKLGTDQKTLIINTGIPDSNGVIQNKNIMFDSSNNYYLSNAIFYPQNIYSNQQSNSLSYQTQIISVYLKQITSGFLFNSNIIFDTFNQQYIKANFGTLTYVGNLEKGVQYISNGTLQSSSNITWDYNTNRLGINTNTPQNSIDVKGNVSTNQQSIAQQLVSTLSSSDSSNQSIIVQNSNMISNLNVQYFQGLTPSYFRNINNVNSGILPVVYGGTGLNYISNGQIIFGQGVSTSTSPNLFWDNTNNRLGINTSNPQYTVDVTGNVNVQQGLQAVGLNVTQSGMIGSNLVINSNLTVSATGTINQITANNIQVVNTTTSLSNVSSNETVNSNLNVGNNLQVANQITTLSNVSSNSTVISNLNVGSTITSLSNITSNETIQNNLIVSNKIASLSNVTTNQTVNSNLNVGINTIVGCNLQVSNLITTLSNVSSNTTINSNLNVGINAAVGCNLQVSNLITTLSNVSSNTTINSNLNVGVNTTIGCNLQVSNLITTSSNLSSNATISQILNVGNSVIIGSNLQVSNLITTLSNLSSNATITSNLVVGNQVTSLSNSTINQTISQNLNVGSNVIINCNLSVGNQITSLSNLTSNETITSNLNVGSNLVTGSNLTVGNQITSLLSLTTNETVNQNLNVGNMLTTLSNQSSNATVKSNLNVGINTLIGCNLQVSNVITTLSNLSSNSTISSNLVVGNQVTSLSNLTTNEMVNSNLNVGLNVVIGCNLQVSNQITSLLNITTNETINSNLNVGNILTTLSNQSSNATVKSNLSIGINAYVSNNLYVSNLITTLSNLSSNSTINSNLLVGINTTIGCNLQVSNLITTLSNLSSNSTINSNLNVGINAYIGSNLQVSNQITSLSNLTSNETINSNLIVGNQITSLSNLTTNETINSNLIVGNKATSLSNLTTNETINSNLTVGNNTTIGSNLSVVNQITSLSNLTTNETINSNLTVGNNTTIGSNLSVVNKVTSLSNVTTNETINSNLNVGINAVVGCNLQVSNQITSLSNLTTNETINSNLNVGINTVIGCNLQVSNQITSLSNLTTNETVNSNLTVSNQLISTISTGTAPFNVTSTTLVSNLNVQYLNGQPQTYYTNASNISSGTLNVAYGGTGINTVSNGYLFYASNNVFAQNSNLYYNASSNFFGINNNNPAYPLDVIGNTQIKGNLIVNGQIYIVGSNTSTTQTGTTSSSTGQTTSTTTTSTGSTNASSINGILQVANGGTGLSTIPQGQILFGQVQNQLGYSSSLCWDSTNIRLGIRTSTPQYAIDVIGNIQCSCNFITSNQVLSLVNTGTAPIQVYSTTLVSNLNVQYLNGYQSVYFTNAGNISSGVLAVNYGGTGLTSLTQGCIPFGQGSNSFGSNSNLFWNSTSNFLGVNNPNPANSLDVIGNTYITGNLTVTGIISIVGASGQGSSSSGSVGSYGAVVPLSSGGTGLSNVTQGYVLFGQGSNPLGQSSNLFWDSINLRLGIRNPIPQHAIDVVGNITCSSNIYYSNQLVSYTPTGTAPFSITSTTLVSNLNVQYLNGYNSAFYTNANCINAGVLGVSYGGIGLSNITQGYVPFGQGSNSLGQSSNLFWDSTNLRLGIRNPSPQNALDVVGNINCSSNIYYSNQLVSTVGVGTAPLSVASTTLVTNLNVQYLNNYPGSYYTNATNISSGILGVSYGGTGLGQITTGYIPVGNGIGSLNTSSNLFFDVNSNNLGIGTTTPINDIHLQSTSSIHPIIGLANTTQSSFVQISSIQGIPQISSSSNGLSFGYTPSFTSNQSNYTEVCRITSNGLTASNITFSNPPNFASLYQFYYYQNQTAAASVQMFSSKTSYGVVGSSFTFTAASNTVTANYTGNIQFDTQIFAAYTSIILTTPTYLFSIMKNSNTVYQISTSTGYDPLPLQFVASCSSNDVFQMAFTVTNGTVQVLSGTLVSVKRVY